MEKGGLDAVWLAAFLGQGDRNDSAHLVAKEKAEYIISNIYRVAKENEEKAEIALKQL